MAVAAALSVLRGLPQSEKPTADSQKPGEQNKQSDHQRLLTALRKSKPAAVLFNRLWANSVDTLQVID